MATSELDEAALAAIEQRYQAAAPGRGIIRIDCEGPREIAHVVEAANRFLAKAVDDVPALCTALRAAWQRVRWEGDHQRGALLALDAQYGTHLAEEFQWGCDTIDFVAEELIAARQRIAALEDALREISDPIAHAVAIAEATGRVVDGDAAVQLSRDANYLRELARLALGSNADAEREAFRRSQAVSADDDSRRENVYTCQRCGAMLVTVDRDEGATPMFMTCGRYNPHGCGGMMHSAMYPKGPRPAHIPAPTHEWYAPDDRERKRLRRKEPALYDHVARGGLLIRPITTGAAHA